MSPDEIEGLQQRIRDLEATLNQSNEHLALALKLTPASLKLMGLLLALPSVTPTMIVQRLGITSDAKVAIHRLRKHLEPFGLTVQSKRSIGYWLEEADKARVRELMEGKATLVTSEVTKELGNEPTMAKAA